jgi:putative ABC transport system ATP-binding protein
MGHALTVENLEWRFSANEPVFLRIPSLSVSAGSIVALVGPSGAGKSTFLFLLAGMDRIPQGRIVWGDRDLSRMTDKERDAWRRQTLGVVFQDFQLVPELSALENVLLPVTFERWSVPANPRSRALELLTRLGVKRVFARASSLSRGEMQRVSIARSLLGRPSVLLADEPTASLDATNEETVSALLLEAAKEEGATLVIATHHGAVRDRADQVLELSHGTLSSEGVRQGGAL